MSEQQTTTEAPAATDDAAQAATTTTTEAPAASSDDAASTTSSNDDGKSKVDPQVKELRSEAAATRRKLREAEAKLEAAEREKLSDLEKAQADAKAADERATAATQRAQQALAKVAITSAARAFHDPADAVDLLTAKVEFDDNGEPVNVDDLVKQLAASKPHLINRSGPSAGGAPGASAPGQQPTKALSRSEFLAEFGLH